MTSLLRNEKKFASKTRRHGFTIPELVIVMGIVGILCAGVVAIHRQMYFKQTITSEMMESIRDIVITVNQLKSDLHSAVLNPYSIAVDTIGSQKSQKSVDVVVGESLEPGDDNFSFLIAGGQNTDRVTYKLDPSKSLTRTVMDENNKVVQNGVLSRGKIVNASLAYELLKSGDDCTVYVKLYLKVQTKAVGPGGLVPVTKEFAFNFFPFVLNNTIKNTAFLR